MCSDGAWIEVQVSSLWSTCAKDLSILFFLFHLAPSGKHSLSSVDSHLCGGDVYFGQIQFDRYSLCSNWRVMGPKKNEEIAYYYS